MKQLIVCILILCSNTIFRVQACGPYYPFGDDIRFVLLKPGTFRYPAYIDFSYSADLFYNPVYSNDIAQFPDSIDENIRLWRVRCKNIPSQNDIYEAIYGASIDVDHPNASNSFIAYLQNKDKAALRYLKFAKNCNPFNELKDDPWERNEYAQLPQRNRLIQKAMENAGNEQDPELKIRYAFLAVRLAYYNRDYKKLSLLYHDYFVSRTHKNIIDYWGMYFMATAEKDSVKKNYYAAQVFYAAPDKRKSVFFFYDKTIPVEKTLALAQSKEEKQAVWMLAGFRRSGKALEILKHLYQLRPNEPGLSVLLLREINKTEDWIYTPYYTSFYPSMEQEYGEHAKYPLKRIADDRLYAKQLLEFVEKADANQVENPELWKLSKAYLKYMTKDFDGAMALFNKLEDQKITDPVFSRQVLVLKGLCLLAQQTEARLPEEMGTLIQKEFNHGNFKFIFALARELEYRGNTTEAAILLSKLKDRKANYYNESYWRNGTYWRTKANHFTLYVNFYDDYFFYLDAQYTADQMVDLIKTVSFRDRKDRLSEWKYSVISKDLPRLYDLLGTKYLRANNLKAALGSFQLVTDTLWNSSHYPYKTYLDANPFYTNMFNEHSKTEADTIHYTKVSLTRKLLSYLEKAENPAQKNRDYYYFLVANCYFNMTQYGNSWLMRRYYWSNYLHKTMLEDDEEYYKCNQAKEYYLKAKATTKSKKFAALCLRMAGRCENYTIQYRSDYDYSKAKKAVNVYFKELKTTYPAYSDDLLSNCESFHDYFNARN